MTESDILNHTIGRVTNTDLEKTTAVWFKDEDEVEGQSIGPVYLQVEGVDGLVPYNKGEAEWHTESLARALAEELGVDLIQS